MNRLSVGLMHWTNSLPATFSLCTLFEMYMFFDVLVMFSDACICNRVPCWANIDEPLNLCSLDRPLP